jgi:hypothetical protein
MLKQPMIEKMMAMRLLGMAEALKAQEQDPSVRELSFLERLGLLMDQQGTGGRIRHSPGARRMPGCARQTLALKRSTIGSRAVSTRT